MTEIEKIKRYIQKTKVQKPDRYELGGLEANALRDEGDIVDIVYTAFLYGRAKGYRAARAEQRKAVKA